MTRTPIDPPKLCRDDLESGRMREIYSEVFGGEGALDDVALSESLTTTLAAKPKGAGWWVFAYGSLLWNPLFPFVEARPVTVRGLHRRFCLYSMASRGTPAAPGLVLALDRGGACTGVAYRLPAPLAMDELHLLWRREMVTDAYRPKWVNVTTRDKRSMVALAFTIRHGHAQYAKALDLDTQASIIAHAEGAFGTSRDYLERTRVALVTHGIVDPYLETLANKVMALRSAPA